MIPKRREIKEENVDAWLMSYADMITLLMCFFIIFVSVSEPKRDKFSEITKGIANKFGTIDLSTPFLGVARNLEAVIENEQLLQDVSVEKTDKSLTLEMSSGSFFKEGSAHFNDAKMKALLELVDTLQQVDHFQYAITIESHTNNIPTKSQEFGSNWELSSARAGKLAQLLSQHGIDEHTIKAIGFGDSRPKVPNLDKKGNPIPENQALNQRVTIKLERTF